MPQALTETTAVLPPLALYVHLPWCVRKCPYCDFNSHALAGSIPESDYVAALESDLESEAARAGGRALQSVFIGGGTPSLFSDRAVAQILEAVARRVGIAPHAEITLEANPGASEAARFRGFRAAGVNRLSVGVQSFDDARLKAIGRIHDAAEALAALEAARAAGFERINLDLMFGLPGQDLAGAVADVERALAFDPGHVSHYELTLEPNTVFHVRPPQRPGEDQRWEMEQACSERLAAAGYERYEISAWGRPGQASRHNLNYWHFGDYLGIGAGAHGKLSTTDPFTVRRNRKARVPGSYMQRAPAGGAEVENHRLDDEALVFEYMLNALRLTGGFRLAEFEARTGLPAGRIGARIESLAARGLMEPADGGWRPTGQGFRFLNDLQGAFL
jgi:putative oxygen-independent coproporphyrinogen III oxidase